MSEYKLSALLELKDKFTNVAQKAGSSLGTLKDKVGGIAGKIKILSVEFKEHWQLLELV